MSSEFRYTYTVYHFQSLFEIRHVVFLLLLAAMALATSDIDRLFRLLQHVHTVFSYTASSYHIVNWQLLGPVHTVVHPCALLCRVPFIKKYSKMCVHILIIDIINIWFSILQ